jgi:hypothetical protein
MSTEGISFTQLLEQAGDAIPDSFEPLPEGDYDLEVVEVSHSMTKKTPSNNMWTVQSKVVGGQFNNRRIWDRVVLTVDNTKALPFFFQKMGAMGLTREFFAQSPQPTNEQITAALKGRRFRARIVQKPYQGEMKNEIGKYLGQSATATPPVGAAPAAPAGVPAPPMPAPAAPAPAAVPPGEAFAPVVAAPAPPAPAPATPAADPYAAAPAPAPAPAPVPVPEQPVAPPPLGNLPF